MARRLKWCFGRREVRLIEPNENLANEYIRSSDETLSVLKDIRGKSNMWLATTKYYCKYFACYALLMRIGIRSEIHDCTIEIIRFLEKEGMIKNGIADSLEADKELRIDNQYYLKNRKVEVDFNGLVDFVLYFKNLIGTMTFDDIKHIRKELAMEIG